MEFEPRANQVHLANEVERLRDALKPFAAVAKGIPSNWPAGNVLTFEEREASKKYQERNRITYYQFLSYLGISEEDGESFPTIADYRRAAEVLG